MSDALHEAWAAALPHAAPTAADIRAEEQSTEGLFVAAVAIAVMALGLALYDASAGAMISAFGLLIIGGFSAQLARILSNRADALHERARAAERIENGEDDFWMEEAA